MLWRSLGVSVSAAVDTPGLRARGHPAPWQVAVGLGMAGAGLREEDSAEGLSGCDPNPHGQVVGEAWPACVRSGNLPELPSWAQSVILAAGSDLVQRHQLPAGKPGVKGEAGRGPHRRRGWRRGWTRPGQRLLLCLCPLPPRPILAALAGSKALRAVSWGRFHELAVGSLLKFTLVAWPRVSDRWPFSPCLMISHGGELTAFGGGLSSVCPLSAEGWHHACWALPLCQMLC